MLTRSPTIVRVFGATHVGICWMSQFQKIWHGGSNRDRPDALYLCSSSRLSWAGDSGSDHKKCGILFQPSHFSKFPLQTPKYSCPELPIGYLLFSKKIAAHLAFIASRLAAIFTAEPWVVDSLYVSDRVASGPEATVRKRMSGGPGNSNGGWLFSKLQTTKLVCSEHYKLPAAFACTSTSGEWTIN